MITRRSHPQISLASLQHALLLCIILPLRAALLSLHYYFMTRLLASHKNSDLRLASTCVKLSTGQYEYWTPRTFRPRLLWNSVCTSCKQRIAFDFIPTRQLQLNQRDGPLQHKIHTVLQVNFDFTCSSSTPVPPQLSIHLAVFCEKASSVLIQRLPAARLKDHLRLLQEAASLPDNLPVQ